MDMGMKCVWCKMKRKNIHHSLCEYTHSNCQNKVFIVRAVEERHEPLLLGEDVVDEKILFVVVPICFILLIFHWHSMI